MSSTLTEALDTIRKAVQSDDSETWDALDIISLELDKQACLEAGIEAVQRIVDCWKSGNLADAVNQAEDWAVNAADLLPDPEPETQKRILSYTQDGQHFSGAKS